MIVNSMSIQEICKAVLSEKEYVKRVIGYKRKDFIKLISKSWSFPVTKTYKTRTAVNKTEFCIKLFGYSKKDKEPTGNIMAIYERPEGKYVTTIEGDWNAVSIYTPHFFQRYRERHIKDESLDMKEVIDAFFSDYWGYCDIWVDEYGMQVFEMAENEKDSQVNMVGAVDGGLIFGFTQGNITLYY